MSTSPRLDTLIGKTVLIRIARLSREGKLIGQSQYAGEFLSMGRAIRVKTSSGSVFTLPPDISGFKRAKPGKYLLDPADEIVENPAYEASFTIEEPAPKRVPSSKAKR